MKTLFLTIVLGLFALTTLNAQEEDISQSTSNNLIFGAKAGINISDLTGDAETNKARLSFHFGATAEIAISDSFAIQPELLYSAQGAKAEYTENFMGFLVDVEEHLKLDYIYVPIMAKYYVVEQLSIEAGPNFGFLVSANIEAEASLDGTSESIDENVNSSFKNFDFGFGFGTSYKVKNGLNFSARYNLGISNILDDEDVEEFSAQNSVFQFSIGYIFN